jgi:hypothetical protein
MAEIDSKIAMSGIPVQMPNPLDAATKALTMQNLLQEHQSGELRLNEQQREASDRQTLRDAFKNNSAMDENGNPVMNREGIMKDLMGKNPLLAQKQALDFKQMDLDNITRQHQIGKSILFDITPGDQASLDRARGLAKQYGLPPLENVLPTDATSPNFPAALKQVQMKSLTAEEQIAQMNKDQEMDINRQKAMIEAKKLGVEMGHFDYTKRFEANQQVQQALESARQSPDATQALKDIYASKKVNTLVDQAKDKKGKVDPNLLNMTQVRLVAGEVGKIATGGAPTLDELHGLTPSAVPQWLSELAEKANNQPTPANAGKFVRGLQRYANSVAEDGRKLVADRSSRIIEQRRSDLGDENYNRYKSGLNDFINEGVNAFDKPKAKSAAPKTTTGSGGSGDVVDVQLPDGRTGTIPRSNLDAAVAKGAKLLGKSVAGTK